MDDTSGLTLDEKRKRQTAYEYLCHLEEAKLWLSHVLQEELPNSSDLEQFLRSGVVLAKVANFCDPVKAPKRRIFDIDHRRYEEKGLHFKHTDNIDLFLKIMSVIGFPKIFYPETTDLYDMKNMPKVIYCIHALSYFLFKLGKAPLVQNLYGKVEFSEEDIKKVQTALEKYGIQMPAFSKIGGILASELSENEAALHAAILLINEAIDTGDTKLLLERMHNTSAQLLRVHEDYINTYMQNLSDAKKKKVASSMEKVSQIENDEDVYDKILTQAEIQGHLNVVNLDEILKKLTISLKNGNKTEVEEYIVSPDLGSSKVFIGNRASYYESLKDLFDAKYKNNKDYVMKFTDLEECLDKCNKKCEFAKKVDDYILGISKSLLASDIESFTAALQKLPEGFPVPDFKRKIMNFQTFVDIYGGNKKKLTHESLVEALKILELLAKINNCVDSKSDPNLYIYLHDPVLKLNEVQSVLSNRYLDNMIKQKEKKSNKTGFDSCDLLLPEVTECVNFVNAEYKSENDLLVQVAKINESIKSATLESLFSLLTSKEAKLNNVLSENKAIYHEMILKAKLDKEMKSGDPEECLWHDEIQSIIDNYNNYSTSARSVAGLVKNLNEELISEPSNVDKVYQILKNDFTGIVDECKVEYHKSLRDELSKRNLRSWNGWCEHYITSPSRVKFYFNHKTGEILYTKVPEGFDENKGYINRDKVQEICNKVTSGYNREKYFKSNEPMITVLQGFYRTLELRLKFIEHLDFKKNKLPHLLIIQSYIRTLYHRRNCYERMKYIESFNDETYDLQIYVHSLVTRLEFVKKMNHYKKNLNNIVALQSLIRASQTLNDYNNLMHQDNPSCKAVCKFVRLLEFDANDLQEERTVAGLLKNIYEKIREVNQQEQEIKEQDIKIGLLVKSRYNLQDLISHSRESKKKSNVVYGSTISKEKIELKEKYGNIFYILQAYPVYPSRLILSMAPNRSTKFTRDTFFAIYNNCVNQREEYVVLKTLSEAANFEVETRINNIQEIYKGDPIIISIAIYLYSGVKWEKNLKQILSDPVSQVVSNKYPININPVDVYKTWISQMETETGQASGMPYDVDTEKALEYEEVRNRIDTAKENLKLLCNKFVESIILNVSSIPYGLKYVAKCLAEAANKKFPDSTPGDVFKIVGHMIYYRLINPCIVSPEKFNCFDVQHEITSEQRRNLASVANILQRAAASTRFDEESGYLTSLNEYLEEKSLQFRKIFKSCIDIELPEKHFNMDEFTDKVSLQKPELRLTCNQIIEIHKLLLEYIDDLCPSENDVLYKAVKKIADLPRPSDLIDQTKTESNMSQEEIDEALGEVVLSLPLNPIVEADDDEKSKLKTLFEDTTNLVIDLMHFETAESLPDILSKKYTEQQEAAFQELQKKRIQINKEIKEKQASVDKGSKSNSVGVSVPEEKMMTLEETKNKIISNSKILIESGLITETDGFKAFVNAVARKITNFRYYRVQRRENLLRLRGIQQNLETKSDYFTRQKEYYNIYLNSCFENITKRKKSKSGSKNKTIIKKTAAKLHSSGVILEIEGLVNNQFKNVIFEISSTEDPGIFNVSAKLFGVQMESVEIVFQDLLQHQYNNVSVIKVLDRVLVNVNLLIHLLNEKFYSKKK